MRFIICFVTLIAFTTSPMASPYDSCEEANAFVAALTPLEGDVKSAEPLIRMWLQAKGMGMAFQRIAFDKCVLVGPHKAYLALDAHRASRNPYSTPKSPQRVLAWALYMHANVATSLLDGKVGIMEYGDVASFVDNMGEDLARQIEAAEGIKVLEPEPDFKSLFDKATKE